MTDSLMIKTLIEWRRIDNDYVYAEYKDNNYVPESNSLDKNRMHGHRCFGEIISINEFEIRHGFVHAGDDNGCNYN